MKKNYLFILLLIAGFLSFSAPAKAATFDLEYTDYPQSLFTLYPFNNPSTGEQFFLSDDFHLTIDTTPGGNGLTVLTGTVFFTNNLNDRWWLEATLEDAYLFTADGGFPSATIPYDGMVEELIGTTGQIGYENLKMTLTQLGLATTYTGPTSFVGKDRPSFPDPNKAKAEGWLTYLFGGPSNSLYPDPVFDIFGMFVTAPGAGIPANGRFEIRLSPSSLSTTAVPEPGTLFLLGSGLLGFLAAGKKFSK